jgi:2-oxoisovalerate dehydrogenase E1 component beta subunit
VIDHHFYDLLVRPRLLAGKHVPGIGLNQVYERNTVPQLEQVRKSLFAVAQEPA